MTPQQRERYELESIMRASIKPIAKHSVQKSNPDNFVSFHNGATVSMPNKVMKWERSA